MAKKIQKNKKCYLDTLRVSGAILEAGLRKKSSRIFLDRSRGLKRPNMSKKLKWPYLDTQKVSGVILEAGMRKQMSRIF